MPRTRATSPSSALDADRALTDHGWIIVARHREPAGAGPRAPWGEAHLKRIGTQLTLCGLPSLGWHAFWHLRHDDVRRWCTDCSAARPARRVVGGS
ncbi:hypothetical protein [Nocardioides albertanoniae]|uniref:hypothetical protein n=1 Tax=Nocardioides albertanoniae TaxID=1175486 RepID=UPI0011503E00|nr:hypothetical protein [Nocardioides albertanoniae]